MINKFIGHVTAEIKPTKEERKTAPPAGAKKQNEDNVSKDTSMAQKVGQNIKGRVTEPVPTSSQKKESDDEDPEAMFAPSTPRGGRRDHR
jgi:hypothetical protein